MSSATYTPEQLVKALQVFDPDFLLVGNIPAQAFVNALSVTRDLLDALQNLLKVHECEGGTKYHAGNIARAAIAKATEAA